MARKKPVTIDQMVEAGWSLLDIYMWLTARGISKASALSLMSTSLGWIRTGAMTTAQRKAAQKRFREAMKENPEFRLEALGE